MRALFPAAALMLIACGSARLSATDPPQRGASTNADSLDPLPETVRMVALPAHFAEGSDQPRDGGAPAAPSATPPEPKPSASDAPDPDPPLRSASQWEYSLHYAKGDVSVTSVRRVELDRPVLSPRRVGRFAFELWIGKELVERVRFDFPLLAADLPPEGKKRPLRDPPRFSPGADTVARVMVPASDRATSALLVDRLTGKRTPLAWPPSQEQPSQSAKAQEPH
jgi:hypothetical protein